MLENGAHLEARSEEGENLQRSHTAPSSLLRDVVP